MRSPSRHASRMSCVTKTTVLPRRRWRAWNSSWSSRRVTRRELQDEFHALQRRLGKTVVLVTHDIREACRLGDRMALLDHGLLVQQGTLADFRTHPASPFVRSFFEEANAIGPAGGDPAA